uniref:Uncharacterized protein SAMR0221 n=2 Tax=Streptomyces ambofaciens TaxID=1889 RepID=Q1RQL5_STRA7|nr:unknown hypothetical protein [Streptomyces ambofaciens ATCC 23877]CAJ87930.1 hypothetical protein SAMR0221 [Streptomyces ambofaciens ATCC 23877]
MTDQGDQMTTTKTSSSAAPVPGQPLGAPGALFSDAASAVTRAGATRQLPRPLDTLTWQEPPALENADDDA